MKTTKGNIKTNKQLEFGILILWAISLTVFKTGAITAATMMVVQKVMLAFFVIAEIVHLKGYMNKDNKDVKSDLGILLLVNTVMIAVVGISI
ncbi:MAG: hypothetical protein RR495_01560 [Anaerovoracaceae bacterium]